MQITQIKKKNNFSFEIYIDNEYAFFLSRKELIELSLFDELKPFLEEGENINVSLPEKVYDLICEQLIIPRGINYAMNLLAARDYTTKQISDKICNYGYSDNHRKIIVERIVNLGFVDDTRYALSYIRMHYDYKSKKYISGMLRNKGVSAERIERAFEEYADELSCLGIDESELSTKAIEKILSKKYDMNHFENIEGMEKQKGLNKVIASLMRKGFQYSEIKNSVTKYFRLNSFD